MTTIRQATVFSNGDSAELRTWSNVPYFVTETLMSKGIKVNRVDIGMNPVLERLWNRSARYLVRQSYFRSIVHFVDVKRRIKLALRQFPDSDVFIFLTFSFSSAGMTTKPTVLFGDWTYDFRLKCRAVATPGYWDRQSIRRENAQIEHADLVLSLFPNVSAYMKNTYQNESIHFLGAGVNAVYEADPAVLLRAKQNSFDLLFVGKPNYREGARALIEAFTALREDHPELKLHIVGMAAENLPSAEGVLCYGYLDKGKEKDRALYYDLLSRAKIFINTTPQWAAFSATLEALYFCTPVVVTPYEDFVETFGRILPFGRYCEENTPTEIERHIRMVLTDASYDRLCMQAHNAVKDRSWSALIDEMIRRSEGVMNDRALAHLS